MNDKLPFEDAFKRKMNELPAGSEDMAWERMKELLEKKEKRKPFAWMNIYTVCGCLIIAALLFIAVTLMYDNKVKQNQVAVSQKNITDKFPLHKERNYSGKTLSRNDQLKNKIKASGSDSLAITDNLKTIHSNKIAYRENYLKKQRINIANTKENYADRTTSNYINNTIKYNVDINHITTRDSLLRKQLAGTKNKDSALKENIAAISQQSAANINSIAFADTSNRKKLNPDTTSGAKQTKLIVKESKQFFIDAGLQLNQSLPLNGEKINFYNCKGNKNFLSDYIPSAYIKLEKNKRWFLQAEFAYASPQIVKPFSYSRTTMVNYAAATTLTNNSYLEKTYYTQIPVSLNFYLKPNLFFGAGIRYNRFRGAVTQQHSVFNNIKADSQYTMINIIPTKEFNDSFFYKSQTALLFQAGYKWKNWDFTLRYSKSLQPFMSYTLPGGTVVNQKNSSLQLLIAYRIIRSKRFDIKYLNKNMSAKRNTKRRS